MWSPAVSQRFSSIAFFNQYTLLGGALEWRMRPVGVWVSWEGKSQRPDLRGEGGTGGLCEGQLGVCVCAGKPFIKAGCQGTQQGALEDSSLSQGEPSPTVHSVLAAHTTTPDLYLPTWLKATLRHVIIRQATTLNWLNQICDNMKHSMTNELFLSIEEFN